MLNFDIQTKYQGIDLFGGQEVLYQGVTKVESDSGTISVRDGT